MLQQTLLLVDSELDKRFKEFDEANPKVYKKLVQMATDLRARGHKKIGMKMLFEVTRWQTMLHTSGDPYKMNNSYCSRYVRKIVSEHPEFDGMFETRTLKS